MPPSTHARRRLTTPPSEGLDRPERLPGGVDPDMDPGNRSLRPEIEVFVLVGVRLYRDGIVDALRRDPRFRVAGSSASLRTARESLDGLTSAPHAALIDL